LKRLPDGTTDIEVVVVREGKNFRGELIGAGLGLIGQNFFGKALAKTVEAIEARNYKQEAAAAAGA
jgi:hypothetical protein